MTEAGTSRILYLERLRPDSMKFKFLKSYGSINLLGKSSSAGHEPSLYGFRNLTRVEVIREKFLVEGPVSCEDLGLHITSTRQTSGIRSLLSRGSQRQFPAAKKHSLTEPPAIHDHGEWDAEEHIRESARQCAPEF